MSAIPPWKLITLVVHGPSHVYFEDAATALCGSGELTIREYLARRIPLDGPPPGHLCDSCARLIGLQYVETRVGELPTPPRQPRWKKSSRT